MHKWSFQNENLFSYHQNIQRDAIQMIVTKTVCQAMSVYGKSLWEDSVIFHKILTDYKERNSFLRSVITYFAVCFSCQIWADGKTLKFLLCGCVRVLFLEWKKGFHLRRVV
ncbi:hypothetical protein AD951_07725, partial [Acetobacter malorum]